MLGCLVCNGSVSRFVFAMDATVVQWYLSLPFLEIRSGIMMTFHDPFLVGKLSSQSKAKHNQTDFVGLSLSKILKLVSQCSLIGRKMKQLAVQGKKMALVYIINLEQILRNDA